MVNLKKVRNIIMVFVCMTAGMIIFESLKESFLPYLSEWGGRSITIIYASLLATVLAVFFFRKREGYICSINKELAEKKIVLQEVHHRIKNNMNSIISILNLQKKRYANPAIDLLLQDINHHISGMMHLYDNLYNKKQFNSINTNSYLTDIINDLAKYYLHRSIKIMSNIEKIDVPVNLGHNLGIITNELAINSMKHAFEDNIDGEIKIDLRRKDSDFVQYEYTDNGPGLPEDLDKKSPSSFGLSLINSISDIIGTYSIKNENGLHYRLIAKIE